MEFDYKNILIMGYGRSGQAVEGILKKLNNVSYTIFDSELKLQGGHYCYRLSKKLVRQFDLIVVSPGVSAFNKYIVYAEKIGIKVIGELEFGYWFTDSPIIGITGTNGKTTTTRLVNSIIGTTYSSDMFGNIGKPLTLGYDEELDYMVCEVSSFQLETTYMFKPYIAVILNIAEDHLDRHKTFENYIKSKLGIIKNCNEKSLMILNADDKTIMSRTENVKAKKYYISEFEKVRGVYVKNGKIYSSVGKTEELIAVEEIENLYGVMQDVLAGILVGLLLKIDKDNIISAVKAFEVSPHRLEVVAKKNNIKFIDDSKSTNIHSTLHAMSRMEESSKVVLLLGGQNKNLKFDEVFARYQNKLDLVVAFGAARNDVHKAAKKYQFENIRITRTFEEGVRLACQESKDNNVVLLSPGCASFDEFSGYEERGRLFAKIVREYINVKG